MMPDHSSTQFVNPKDLFWGILDLARVPTRDRRKRETLDLLFDARLPVPIEQVHAVYQHVDDDRVIACAALVDVLRDARSKYTVVRPSSVPEWLDAPVDLDNINLLHGPMRAVRVDRARSRLLASGTAAAALLACTTTIGAWRHAAAYAQGEQLNSTVRETLYEQALDPSVVSTQPSSVRLTSEILRLTSITNELDLEDPGDSQTAPAELMSVLLAAWPDHCNARTERLSVGPDVILIAVLVPDTQAAGEFVAALSPPAGWLADQPRIRAQRDGTSVQLRFRPEEPS